MIVAYKGVCSGYYIQDSGDVCYFDVTAAQSSSTNYYSYTKDLDNPSSVTICINAEGDDAPSSVTVYIYADDTIVEQETFSREVTSYWDNTTSGYVYSYAVDGSVTYEFSDDSTSSE
jgi:hypothetical protein